MNIQTLIVVILRLMSLNFLLQVVVQLTPQILRFTDMYRRAPLEDSRSLLVLPLVLVVGLIVAAVLFWVLALPIARLVARGVPHDLSFGSLSLVDCYSIAFIGVGLFYICSHLPQVLNWAHYLFKMSATNSGGEWKQQVQWYDVSQAVITFIMGVVLFVNGRRWAVVLARRQTDSELPTAAVNQKHEADT
jgi:hypothetical protein